MGSACKPMPGRFLTNADVFDRRVVDIRIRLIIKQQRTVPGHNMGTPLALSTPLYTQVHSI